jgi:hypothetical protein
MIAGAEVVAIQEAHEALTQAMERVEHFLRKRENE